DNWLTDIEYGGSSFFNMASFLSAGIRDTIHSYRPNWLNFNSDNYPARGGTDGTSITINLSRFATLGTFGLNQF
ncbi:hypothetical protein, partial [Vibrio ouci]|uniref:hypothetical protein n=1 Tax=Vibrio ouci TaxID=2499078 RepID=UPI001ABFEFAA